MASLAPELAQQALDALQSHSGNKTAAASALGIPRRTFTDRVDAARRMGLTAFQKPAKPRIRVPARSSYKPAPDGFGKSIRVMVWGCAHDSPSLPDKTRFENAGKLAAELQPDYIVDLGDTMDLDSLSGHAIPGSQDDRDRPYFRAEIASLTEAQAAFDAHAPSGEIIPRYHLNGNHENRANRYENSNPTSQGVFTTEIDQVYARFGWAQMAFREWLFLNQVGFTHAPINGMGREVGGVNADATVARESTHSVVWSHTHKSNRVHKPKFGVGNAITVFNSGCYMPQGYIKQYAGLSMTGWTYGLHLLTLRDGDIEAAKTWSELELREMFA